MLTQSADINNFEKNIDEKISKAKKTLKQTDDYTPSLSLELTVPMLYKIGDTVKTPKGKLTISDVRMTINCEIYDDSGSDFLSPEITSKTSTGFKIEKDITVYYKFKNPDESQTKNIFYTESQLKRYYEEGKEPITTQNIIESFQKTTIKKRSIFKRIFGK